MILYRALLYRAYRIVLYRVAPSYSVQWDGCLQGLQFRRIRLEDRGGSDSAASCIHPEVVHCKGMEHIDIYIILQFVCVSVSIYHHSALHLSIHLFLALSLYLFIYILLTLSIPLFLSLSLSL